MSSWNDELLKNLFLNGTPLIDVRAPVEFSEGAIPNSINLPIINDEERKLIGTCYKEFGQEAAIKLGHELVHGEVKEKRIDAWARQMESHPSTEIFCFRGGMRSQLSCEWLLEKGFIKNPIPGGYKRLRRFFLTYLDEGPEPLLYRLGGRTGSGKTTLLKKTSHHIDLEGLANHRGSSFGGLGSQPSQVSFENALSLSLMKNENQKTLIEDESVTIGKCTLPLRFYKNFRNTPLIILKTSMEDRIQNIFSEYVQTNRAEFFLSGLERLKKRFSSLIYSAIREEIEKSFARGLNVEDHSLWISLLLEHYYDGLYEKDLKRQTSQVCFEGAAGEVEEYFKNL